MLVFGAVVKAAVIAKTLMVMDLELGAMLDLTVMILMHKLIQDL